MLAFDPKKRISVDNALRHPYLSAFHSEERFLGACTNGPMKADIESICEDQDHILSSVVGEIMFYQARDSEMH